MIRPLFIFLFLISIGTCALAQTECLNQINNQVWDSFQKAFENLDAELMASVHSKELVRVTGNNKSIIGYEEYITNYRTSFGKLERQGGSRKIELRFFERICADAKASERGIYKLTVGPGSENEKAYYGQFHVILKKENNQWKIVLDYDSDERGTIGEEQFLNAHPIDVLNVY